MRAALVGVPYEVRLISHDGSARDFASHAEGESHSN